MGARPRGGRAPRCRSTRSAPPEEAPPRGAPPGAARARGDRGARAAPSGRAARASSRTSSRSSRRGRGARRVRARPTCGRSGRPGFVTVEVALPLGDVTARAAPRPRRPRPRLRRRRRRGSRASRTWSCAGCAATTCRRCYARLAAAGLGRDGAGTAAKVTSCPGAESCKLAVTQSRGLGRLLEEHLRARPELVEAAARARPQGERVPERLRPAPRRGDRIPGQRAQGGRPGGAPVLRPRRRRRSAPDGARFGRLAAKIPARRVPEALERLVALYRAERAPGEDAPAFFARVEPARAKAALADLAELAPEALRPEDLVDLGETAGVPPGGERGERPRGVARARPSADASSSRPTRSPRQPLDRTRIRYVGWLSVITDTAHGRRIGPEKRTMTTKLSRIARGARGPRARRDRPRARRGAAR